MPPTWFPFVGRSQLLSGVVADARRGRGTAVVAPVGGGRTRMLREVSERLEPSVRVARLTATASLATVPYGIFLGLLERPELASIAAADSLGRAALLRSAVRGRRFSSVVIDEVSLLDAASAAFVHELAMDGVAAVVSTTSGRRIPDGIRALVDEDLVRRVELPPLTADDCAALAAHVLGGQIDGGLAADLASASMGQPALLLELLRDLGEGRGVRRSAGVWLRSGTIPTPRSVRTSVIDRFGKLDPETRRWTAAVAVAEQLTDDLADLLTSEATADAAEREGWTLWDSATRLTRMLQRSYGAAVSESLGPRARATVIRQLLDAYGRIDRPLSDPERIAVARWRLEAGLGLDPMEAIGLAELTSIAAPEVTEDLLRHSIAEGGGAYASFVLAEHMKRTNRFRDAEVLLRSSLADADVGLRVEAVRIIAIAIGFGIRRSAEQLAVVDAHLEVDVAHPDLLTVRAMLLLFERRVDEAVLVARAVRETTDPLSFASVFAGIVEVLAALDRGDTDGTLELVDLLRHPAAAVVDRMPEGPDLLVWFAAAAPLDIELDIATAEAAAEHHYERLVRSGAPIGRGPFAFVLALCRAQRDDTTGALRLLHEADASPGFWRDAWLPAIIAALAELEARSGDVDRATTTLARLEAEAVPPLFTGRVELARAEIEAVEGRTAEAIARLHAARRSAQVLGASVEAFDLAAAAVRLGDREAAEATLAMTGSPRSAARDLQRAHAAALFDGDDGAYGAIRAGFLRLGLARYAEAVPLPAPVSSPAAQDGTPADRRRAESLTSRERQLAELAAGGASDRDIADRLGIAVRTAQTHLARVYTKLGVHGRQEIRDFLAIDAGD